MLCIGSSQCVLSENLKVYNQVPYHHWW